MTSDELARLISSAELNIGLSMSKHGTWLTVDYRAREITRQQCEIVLRLLSSNPPNIAKENT